MALYNSSGIPFIPGAYITNMGSGATYYLIAFPVYSSISDLANFAYANRDNMYWIMPGYKIECYNVVNYQDIISTFDNTNGSKIRYVTISPVDSTRSVKLYFNNIEITEKYTYPVYNITTNSYPFIANDQLTGSYMIKSMPLLPGAYITNGDSGCMPVFWSIPNFATYDNASNLDNYTIVMPGYCIILYYGNDFTGNKIIIDNTTGKSIMVVSSNTGWAVNNINSCELYYNNYKINQSIVMS